MDTAPTTPPPFTLLECAYRHLTRELCRALPPPPTPEEEADRDKAAIAQVASLHPDNTAEFELAAMFVVAAQRAHHCLARADEPGLPSSLAVQWTAKADLMMRQANSTMRSLLRLQATRHKLEADPKAYDRGERIEHTMTVIMTGAIADQPPVSSNDLESRTTEIEIPPRQTAPATSAQPLAPQSIPATQNESPLTLQTISPDDPESRSAITEIPPRHSRPTPTQRWRPLRPGYDFPLSDLAKEYDDAV